jgi:predicted secreted hydrolase
MKFLIYTQHLSLRFRSSTTCILPRQRCLRLTENSIAVCILCMFFLLFSPLLQARELIVFPKDHGNHPIQALEVWSFTGQVETADGKKYAYMYLLKRKHEMLHVFANIVDLTTQKEVLLYKDKGPLQAISSSDELMQWKVGKAFMKYNVISDSWLFGLLDDKNGFNFRLKGVRNYVLNGKEGYVAQEKGTKNFEASYSAQSMNINGHLTLDGKSSFVTGKNSWFEHRWGMTLSRHNATKYALVTCRFDDNTGLRLYEWFGSKDLWPSRLKTGTYQNALDKSVPVSSFSLAKSTKKNQWFISIPSLKINISATSDSIPEYDVIQVKNNKTGYCFVTEKGF